MVSCNMLVAKIAVGKVVSLRDVRAEFCRVEFGYSARDRRVYDCRLQFHGVVAEERDDSVESWVLSISDRMISEGKSCYL